MLGSEQQQQQKTVSERHPLLLVLCGAGLCVLGLLLVDLVV